MSEARIKILRTQRSNAKRVLTNFKKYLDSFTYERDFPILEKRLKEIEQNRVNFETCRLEIEELEEDSDSHETYRDEFDEKYYEALSKATTL